MPYIEASFFEERFSETKFSGEMVAALTEAVSSILGEEIGSETTVVLHGVPRERGDMEAGPWKRAAEQTPPAKVRIRQLTGTTVVRRTTSAAPIHAGGAQLSAARRQHILLDDQ